MRSLRFSERCHRAGGIRIAMAITVLLLLLVAPWLGVADVEDEPPPPQVDMGANLAPLRDWSTQLAFQDVFKMSRRFFTQNEGWVSGGKNPWDTGVIDQIPQDADGYPLELPYSVPGTPDDVPQIVKALMYRSLEGHYPTGHYVCLFDGTGTLDITGVTNEQLVAPGRYEFDELVPTDNGISVEILSSQLGDHVRNIRIFQEQFDDTYATQVWNPDFIANLQSFNVQSIRFMDWQGGNKPDLQTWADRSTPTFQTQTTRKGVAVEHMVDLCNQMAVSPWFSMPYINGDDYNTQFATYVRDNLDPSLGWPRLSNSTGANRQQAMRYSFGLLTPPPRRVQIGRSGGPDSWRPITILAHPLGCIWRDDCRRGPAARLTFLAVAIVLLARYT